MFDEGDIACIKKLLLPAKRVLKAGPQIKYEALERRVELWNQIRMNSDRYQDGECGTFLKDLDSHFRSQFDAALVALAVSMKANGESFDAIRIFSAEELGLYERIERYNVFEILTVNDIKKKSSSGTKTFSNYSMTIILRWTPGSTQHLRIRRFV